MEIRKSMGRFLSIFFIVALGISLFVGLRATDPDIRLSGDAFADENELMDIKIVSTMGLTEEDIEELTAIPEVKNAMGAYSVDVLCQVEDNKQVVRVMAETEQMNRVTLTEGRMPKKTDECLIDKDFLKDSGYKVGDTIVLESGTDDELSETLETNEYKIVGSGTSSYFFALDRGSSTIGNGSVGGFLIVRPEAFTLDVYTEIYIMVQGAKEAMSFADKYDSLVEDAIEKIEEIQDARCEARQNELKSSAQSEIDEARNELNEKKRDAEEEIAKNENELKKAERDIENGKAQIQTGRQEIEKGRAELTAGRDKLEETKLLLAQMTAAGAPAEQLQVIEAESVAGEKKLNESEAVLNTKEQELLKAEKELLSGEKELKEGKAELEKAKKELEQQIADGEQELRDAEEEVVKIELPKWYVLDRSSIPEYTGYGDNADRIAALSAVFPSLFFLVAALISLTTMTRMVEEQRVQIGTLKALGYSKVAIIGKYLGYALFATIGGSIVGWLVGEKLFPYIIIVAYKVLYINIPHVIVPYHWEYGVTATVIAVVCTGGATFFACYKELMAQPAELMRPEAPKVGKRTWIERVSFIWEHLNFSWKSSMRNLFRYKKRFIMTIFGIGGCMGLLMVGYGLRDSITGVGQLQYQELQKYNMSVYTDDGVVLDDYLNENEDISNYMAIRSSSITAKHEDEKIDAYLTIIQDLDEVDEYYSFRDRVSKEVYQLTDKGVILSEKTADLLGLNVGDQLTLFEEGVSEHQVEIAAICENYMMHYVYMSASLYEELYETEFISNNLLVKADVNQETLEKIGENILTYEGILNVQYTSNISSQLNGMLSALDDVMIVLIIVAGMLSFVVLYNLNNININERRRELATLKVLGFYDMEVANYVYRENILLTLLGTIVGCEMGRLLHLFTIKTVEVDNAMFGREIFPSSYVICAIFTIGFSVLVNAIMYFKLKKIDMVESLKSVE